MTLHNPAQLDPSLVGPNHKLLSTEDLDKPLPEGAEFWQDIPRVWVTVHRTGIENPHHMFTYRIPLLLSDRLRSEQQKHWDEKEEQIRVAEGVEKSAEWQYRVTGNVAWVDPENGWSLGDMIDDGRYEFRLKPAAPTPQSIPWTLESHPDVACVKSKTDPSRHYLVTLWEREPREGCDRAYVEGIGWIKCQVLHDHWLQRSGEPAGQKVTV